MRRTKKTVSIAEARERLLSSISFSARMERVPVTEAIHRVTAEGVIARQATPSFPAAAMDGIAVDSQATQGATASTPIVLRIGIDYDEVNTGDPLPVGRNSVIMIEHVRNLGQGRVEIDASAVPWKHVRQMGEDVAIGELLLPARHRIRPLDVGAFLAGGVEEVRVLCKPQVVVIPTGSEMVPPGTPAQRGKMIEFNSEIIHGTLEEWGAQVEVTDIVPDDLGMLHQVVAKMVQSCDILLVLAGSSAGTKDFTQEALAELGEIVVHQVAARPGKPTILAQVDGKPVLGLPGYPVSACLALEWFLPPLIDTWYGYQMRMNEQGFLNVRMLEAIKGKKGGEDFIRLGVMYHKGEYHAFPMSRGAGVTMSLVMADAMLSLSVDCEGVEAGAKVEVKLLRPLTAIKQTLWIGGVDDPLLDRWMALFPKHFPGWTLRKRIEAKESEHFPAHGRILRSEKGDQEDKGPQQRGEVLSFAKQEWGLLMDGLDQGTEARWLLPPCKSAFPQELAWRLQREGIVLDEILRKDIDWTTPLIWKAAACVVSGVASGTIGPRAVAEEVGLKFVQGGTCTLSLEMDDSIEFEGKEKLIASLQSMEMREVIHSLPGYVFF
ncbi:putative molybdopterin biosynthesis protein [Marininema mesophilum]|uniref:Molybdopterin molybdenumtransferase n=1 Tax=Marininema mesophilum TaxID=1048340 RepID=A0A1H3AX07_9BACL|nr:molybdenum cofactor synthesis domain-containing protein [Marininema mesophilum]SDX34232.1 putative molybdopterin biosynthesis protein [Marininema mesophilum]